MTAARLTCRNVAVDLAGVRAVDDVSLTVASGEWVSIIGPNGAGKSTLLRAIGGLVEFDGDIVVGNQSTTSLSHRDRAQHMALVPQTQMVPAGMRVLDYVLLGRNPWIGPLGRESEADIAVVQNALTSLDAWGLHDRHLEALSGGERQRVIIARAIAQQAPLLLLDEPTTSLDIGHQQELLELLDHLRTTEGLTLLTTLHDLTLAGHYADRLILLSDGRIAASGTAAEVLTPDNISGHYRAAVRILTDNDGTILVVPVKPERPVTHEHH